LARCNPFYKIFADTGGKACDAMTATGVGCPMTLADEDIELQLHAERRYFESCVTSPITPSAAHYQSAELDFMTTSLSLMLFRMWSFASNALGRGIR
jgi:hypothetical protein